MRARIFDPRTGVFISVDPLTPRTHSPYTYASADPVNRDDPAGLFAEILTGDIKRRLREAWERTREIKNARYTGAALAAHELAGHDCSYDSGDRVHYCFGSGRPITVGNAIFLGPRTEFESMPEDAQAALKSHELKRSDQWAIFGRAYPVLYYGQSANSAVNCALFGNGREMAANGDWDDLFACSNVFEMWAGLEDGGYDCD